MSNQRPATPADVANVKPIIGNAISAIVQAAAAVAHVETTRLAMSAAGIDPTCVPWSILERHPVFASVLNAQNRIDVASLLEEARRLEIPVDA